MKRGQRQATRGRIATGPGRSPDDPLFFPTPADLRAWLEANHDRVDEIWIGLYKKATGRPSVTWPEVVDQLLCYGWIDGIRKSRDAESYIHRVTPRRKGSTWSAVNVRRIGQLMEAELVAAPGLAAWEARDPAKVQKETFSERRPVLGDAYEAEFRRQAAAWAFWEKQPPGYRRSVTHWVVSAKKEETRQRRLAKLIALCAAGERVPGA